MRKTGRALQEGAFIQFDDIIDGYFPLCVSIGQLLMRLGTNTVVLELSHAPIMAIDGLAPDAPVPLRIDGGQIGLIEHMIIHVETTSMGVSLSGLANWRWFGQNHTEPYFDPWTRLAEPSFVEGIAPPSATCSLKTVRPSATQLDVAVEEVRDYPASATNAASWRDQSSLSVFCAYNHISRAETWPRETRLVTAETICMRLRSVI